MNQVVLYIIAAMILGILLLPITVETRSEEGSVFIGEGPTWIELSVEGLSKLTYETLVIYFEPSSERLAEETAQAAHQALQLASDTLGIAPAPLSLALFPRENFGDISVLSFKIEKGIWPLFITHSWQNLQDSDLDFQDGLYWTIPHEAIEGVIAPLFYHDWRHGWPSRWIGDGLSAYAGYVVTKEYTSKVANMRLYDYKQKITRLLEKGKVKYDLVRDFVGSDELQLAGYGVALAFWLGIAQRYGEKTIREFWNRVSSFSKKWCIALGLICFGGINAREAARILSELTGEDIWTKLQNMNLREVLQTLEAAAGGLNP